MRFKMVFCSLFLEEIGEDLNTINIFILLTYGKNPKGLNFEDYLSKLYLSVTKL